jgi:hypothetical protein
MADYSRFDVSIVPWLQRVWADRDLIRHEVLLEAVPTDARKEGAWQVYERYSDPTRIKLRSGNPDWEKFQMTLNTLKWFFGIPWTGGPDADSFFHFLRGIRQGYWRVYAHLADPWADNWELVAKYCLRNMTHGHNDIVEFKVAGPGIKRRSDQIVIYLVNEPAMERAINDLRSQMPQCFAGSVPPGVKQVVPGLGWSKEPLEAEHGSPAVNEIWNNQTLSFGSYLSAVIYMALEQSWQKTEADYVHELIEFFLNVGIDPANPQLLRTFSWEQLKQFAQVSNAKIATSGIAPTTIVFTDKTKPFPSIQ